MRIVEKEVTVLRPVYIACDGKEFMDEDECEAYEIELVEKTLKLYNNKYEPTDIDGSMFVNLITDEDVENFKKVCEWHGVCSDGVDKPALYIYDDSYRYSNGFWINIDDACFHIRGGLTDGKE